MARQSDRPSSRVPADRPFANPNVEPTEDGLEQVLGAAVGGFDVIRGLASGLEQEWSFYRTSGWMLRIHDGRKALLYLTPLRGAFKLSMAIREPERDAFAADPTLAALQPALASARKVPEGFALSFDIAAGDELGTLRSFLGKLVAARKPGGIG